MATVKKSKNTTFYVLEYTNDTPYHESIERWFAESFDELELYYEDWMDNSICISVGEWNCKVTCLGDCFEEITENNDKIGDILPTNIAHCRDCNIFYNRKVTMCKICKEDCVKGYDDVCYEKL